MKQLTRAEEEVMQALWKLQNAFVKEIVAKMKAPKPHYNTVSTIISILVEKGFVSYEPHGRSYEYFPLISKEEYAKKMVKQLVKKYYGNSFTKLVEAFSSEKSFKKEDIRDVLKTADSKPAKKKAGKKKA